MQNRFRPQDKLRRVLDMAEQSSEQFAKETRFIYNGIVVSNKDPLKSRRLQIRVRSIDTQLSDGELPWCVSILPNHLNVLPKPGEHVLIILSNPWNPSTGRYYIGPIFSDDNTTDESYSESLEGLGFVKPKD